MTDPSHITITCPQCGHANWFAQPHPYHAGYTGQGFLYNETGICTLTWNAADPDFAAIAGGKPPWALSDEERRALEERLQPSPDGSRWLFRNPARCFRCRAPISGSIAETIYYLRYPCTVDRDVRLGRGIGLKDALKRMMSAAPWGGRDVVLGVLVAAGLSAILYAVIYAVLYLTVKPDLDLWFGVFSSAAELVLLLPVWWFARHRHHATLGQLGVRRFAPSWLLAGIGLLVAFYIFNGVYSYVLSQFGLQMQRDLTPTVHQLSTPWPLVFAVVILAPLAEETFFRGFVFNGLRGRMDWWWAAVISSALFAAAHLDVLFLLPAFALGFLFAFVYQKTDSVWPGMILHFLVNGLAMTLVLT